MAGPIELPRPPSAEAVRAALARTLATNAFRHAPRLSAFLTFIVEKTLAGEAHEIKGYTIATQALGRGLDFDPQADPIVRVEAGRLRKALQACDPALSEEPLRIVVPRGGYVPRFERRQAEVAPLEPAPVPAPMSPSPRVARFWPARRLATVAHRWWHVAAASCVLAGLAGTLGGGEGRAGFGALHPGRADPGEMPSREMPGREMLGETRPVVLVRPVETGPVETDPVEIGPVEMAGAGPGRVSPGRLSPGLLRSMVVDGLARFEHIAVIDGVVGQGGDAVRYAVNLRVMAAADRESNGDAAGEAAVIVRLTHVPSGRVAWARSFSVRQGALPGTLADAARAIVATIAPPRAPPREDAGPE